MSSFFSFLKTKKIPTKEECALLFSPPFTRIKIALSISIALFVLSTLLLLRSISALYSKEIPAYGGVLHEGVIGAPRFITPTIATTDTDRLLVALLFSGMISYDSQTQVITPILAETVTTSSDASSISITLKKGLTFSDGSPLTSEDVAFSFQQYSALAPTTKEQIEWDSIVVQTPDPYTVTLSTTTKTTPLLAYAAKPIISKKQWGEVPIESLRESTNTMRPVGTGAYTLSHIRYKNTVPEKIVLKRNKHATKQQHPFIDTVIITPFANQLALQNALINKTINSTGALNPLFITEKVQDIYTVTQYATPAVVGIFAQAQLSLENKKLLETIAPLIDRNKIVATIENGYGIPLGDTTTTSDIIYSGLERLGYKKDANGVLLKQGVPVRLSIALRKDTALLDTATLIAENLKSIGIITDIKVFDQGTYIDEIGKQSFSLLLEKTDTAPTGYILTIPLYKKTIAHITTTDITPSDTVPITTKQSYWESIPRWSIEKDMVWKWFTK